MSERGRCAWSVMFAVLVLMLVPMAASAQQPPLRTEPLPGGINSGGCRGTSGTRERTRVDCSEARNAERELHQAEILALRNARTDANAEYQIARRNCGDGACRRREHDKQTGRLKDIANRQTAETARHKKQMNTIAVMERDMRDTMRQGER